MKINYIDYQKDLFSEAIDSNRPKVYVFDNFHNMLKAREYYNKPFLQQESIFITTMDLKEKLFPIDRLILKEEKLSVIFYELLTDEEKRKLKIDNYFDVIDLAAEFFQFYAELNEYNVDRIDALNLRDWQQEKYRILQSIRDRYINRMDELNYTDRTLTFNFENFSTQFLNDYQDIVFVNVLNFTPKEKELLNRLEEAGKNVQLYLQVPAGDYDQVNLKLKAVSLPEAPGTEIELYHTEEDLLQIVNLIFKAENLEDCSILDADYNNSSYHRLLSVEKIKIDKDISFTETKIFRFLKVLFNLYSNADTSEGSIQLEIGSLLEACYLQEFRDYYQLHTYYLKGLQELVREDFVYVPDGLIEYKGLGRLKLVLEDIKKISQMESLREFCDFLESIHLKKLNDKLFYNNISQYFDSLLELHSLEEMGIVSSWDKYFNDKARGFFQMVLNYLRYKQIKEVRDEEAGIELENLLTAPHSNRENLMIMNASKGVIPSETAGGFLLTDKQRSELGLKTVHDRRLEEKYYFFRHIFSSKKAIIYSLKNLEKNITTSSFVDELRLKYGIKLRDTEIKAEHYPAVAASIFPSGPEVFGKKIDPATKQKDKLIIEKEDFPEKGFSLGYYKYKTLQDCHYRFYLEQVARLEEERVLIEKKLTPKVIGIIVHEIFADIINEAGREFQVEERLVKQFIENKFASYNYKINNYYKKYYRDILLNKVRESILHFFKEMKRRINGEIRDILLEWSPADGENRAFFEHKFTHIFLNGRIDLLIAAGDKRYIVDFKTGGSSDDQLDFYFLMINPDLKTDLQIEKGIYAVMDARYLPGHPGSEVKFARKMRENISQLFAGGEYSSVYKSRCRDCSFADICRVVVRK